MAIAVKPLNTPNKTSNFYPADDQWVGGILPIVASVAMQEGSALMPEITANTTTGNYKLMGTANSSGGNFYAILQQPIVSTDTDYATAGKLKAVWIPRTMTAKAYFTVGAGTFTLIDVGKTVAFHSDSRSLAVDTAGLGAVISDYISSTRGKCQFSAPVSQTA